MHLTLFTTIYMYIYYCAVVWWGNEVTQIKENFKHFNLNQYKTHVSLKKKNSSIVTRRIQCGSVADKAGAKCAQPLMKNTIFDHTTIPARVASDFINGLCVPKENLYP